MQLFLIPERAAGFQIRVLRPGSNGANSAGFARDEVPHWFCSDSSDPRQGFHRPFDPSQSLRCYYVLHFASKGKMHGPTSRSFRNRVPRQRQDGGIFSQLFGWEMQTMGPATMINTGSTIGIQGHITSLGHEPHNYTTFYVQVDDVRAYLDKAASLGGKTLVLPVELPTGTFAWMSDLEGNIIGLWKPK